MSNGEKIGDIATTSGPEKGEVTFEWKIKDFFSLSDEIDCDYTSPAFVFSDTCLYLRLTTKRKNIYGSEWLGLFIRRVDSGPPKKIPCKCGIKGLNGLEILRKGEMESTHENKGNGWITFCSRSTLQDQNSNLMPGNVLTIMGVLKNIDPSVTNGVEEFLKSMQNLLKSGEAADFTIKIQDKEYPVHRAILGARSDVLKSLVTLDMIEKNKGVVTIADCDPEVFSDFLQYIYTGSTPISAENVVGLYTVSDKYDVNSLKEECSQFIKATLTVANICDVIRLALKHDEKELLKSSTEFFCNNSLAIVKTADWQIFLKENPTLVNELFIKALSKYEGIA